MASIPRKVSRPFDQNHPHRLTTIVLRPLTHGFSIQSIQNHLVEYIYTEYSEPSTSEREKVLVV